MATRLNHSLRAFFGIITALTLCLLVACSSGGSGQAVSANGPGGGNANKAIGPNDTWTVLVYMCGSNLESQAGYATNNIVELQEADFPKSTTFVLETGGANEWQNDLVDPSKIQRYEVHDGKLFLQDEQPRTSKGNADTFADFLTWGVKNYPADHYMLVFWDHGGGSLAGVCQDELDGDALSLPELQSGIANAGVTFDVVGFDTCLMATLETAQMLAPYADYMVASEEVEPACGWAWKEWAAWFSNPTGNVAGLGQTICDAYLAKCEDNGVASTATLSTVDLSQIAAVSSAFETAATDMAKATEKPADMQRLVNAAGDVKAFGHANYIEGYTDMVDLSDLMNCMSKSLASSADAVEKAVASAVVYEVHGPQATKSTGLSVFYPLKIDEDTFSKYFALVAENGLGNIPYLQFLATQAGTYSSVDWSGKGVAGLDPVTEDDAKGTFNIESRIDDDLRYHVDITGNTEWIANTTYKLGQLLDDGSVVMLGSDNNMDLYIDPKTGAVEYSDRFGGGWYKIGDAYVYADIVDMSYENDKASYNLYSTPVEWTTKNKNGKTVTIKTNVLSMYDYPTNSYKVLCVYDDADETGMAGKTTASLKEGDQLNFRVSRMINGEVQGGSTGTITWTKDTPMTEAFAGNVTYVYMATVTDIFGNEYTPQPALLTYSGGKRSEAKLVNLQTGAANPGSGTTSPGSSVSTGSSPSAGNGSLVDFTNKEVGYTFKVDKSYIAEADGLGANVYTGGKQGQAPFFKLTIMKNSTGRSVDDLLENTAKNISDKYKDTMIAAPSFNTIKLTNRQLKGFEYSYTSGGGKAMTALNYAEDVGGYFFVWTASYYADDSATPAAMQIAADTLQSLS